MLGVGNCTVVRVLSMLSLDRSPATTHAYLINFTGIVAMLMSIAILQEWPSIYQILSALRLQPCGCCFYTV